MNSSESVAHSNGEGCMQIFTNEIYRVMEKIVLDVSSVLENKLKKCTHKSCRLIITYKVCFLYFETLLIRI